MKMKAAIMIEAGKPLVIDEVELAAPGPHEVLVRIKASGVCHSDLNSWLDPATPVPTVLGHEGAGEVVETGSQVRGLKAGDRVSLNWMPFCGTCPYCQHHQVHLCEKAFKPMFEGTLLDGTSRLSFRGRTAFHYSLLSTFAEYAVVPEMSCVKLPDGMPFAQAALLGCGVATGYGAAVYAARVTPGSSVAVFGIGGVGINAIQGAKIAGAAQIIACDVKEQNLEIARRFGATHVVNVAENDAEEAVKALTGGYGVDFAIDATGNPRAGRSCWLATRKGGTAVIVGAFPADRELSLPAGGFHRLGKTLKGSFYGDIHPLRDIRTLANLYLNGQLMLDELILEQVPLENINEALDKFHDSRSVNVGRSVIIF